MVLISFKPEDTKKTYYNVDIAFAQQKSAYIRLGV